MEVQQINVNIQLMSAIFSEKLKEKIKNFGNIRNVENIVHNLCKCYNFCSIYTTAEGVVNGGMVKTIYLS